MKYHIYINDSNIYPFRNIPFDKYFTADTFDIDFTNLCDVKDFCDVFNKYSKTAHAFYE